MRGGTKLTSDGLPRSCPHSVPAVTGPGPGRGGGGAGAGEEDQRGGHQRAGAEWAVTMFVETAWPECQQTLLLSVSQVL